jgi:hypothetical protein
MAWPLSRDEVQLFFSPDGLVVVAPLPGERRHRIVATVDEAPSEPSLADVQALLDARGPRQPRALVDTVLWSSRFRVHHRLAERFRAGAVFLCGDAAHVHSPAGGQGMNTGIQDAANLAWKLALVLDGKASGSLLDSYERERRAVAENVVEMTHRLTRLATVQSSAMRALRNVVIAGANQVGPLPGLLAGSLSQLDVAYPDGWRVDQSTAVERLIPSTQVGVGNALIAFRLVVPVGFGEQAAAEAALFPTLPIQVEERHGSGEALLVRPDGYVAGRGSVGDVARLLASLGAALGSADPSFQRLPLHA